MKAKQMTADAYNAWERLQTAIYTGLGVFGGTNLMWLYQTDSKDFVGIIMLAAIPIGVAIYMALEQWKRYHTFVCEAYEGDEAYSARTLEHYRSEAPNKKAQRHLKAVPKKD